MFISYRRDDASAWAGRLHDGLATRIDADGIYQDVVAVAAGEDFALSITSALERCDVVLAVIGPQWLTVVGSGGVRRLDSPDDYVRIELGRALALDKHVIPVLVGGAAMPPPDQLPDELAGLSLRQAVTLDDATWRRDVYDLMNELLGPPRSRKLALIAVGGAAAVIAVVVVVWALTRDRSDGFVGSSEPDPSIVQQPCPPDSPEWVDIQLKGSEEIGTPGTWGAWDVAVVNVQAHQDQSASDVVLEIEATNRSDASEKVYSSFFTLVADGRPFEPVCLSFIGGAGETPDPNATTSLLVGFEELPDDFVSALALEIKTPSAGRIDLTPATNP